MRPYDVIVVGVGGMGSAVAAHCASRGQRVLALERFEIGHACGSSHGHSRIIRLAYFEHPSYVPLLRRAFVLWRELERSHDTPLLHITGALDVGSADSEVFTGSLQSCQHHALPHEVLDAGTLAARYPGWRPAANAQAVFQPDGGFLHPERCVAAHVAMARAHGAEVRAHEPVLRWTASERTVSVETACARYEGGQLVLTGGPWMGELMPALAPMLTVERQVVGWFALTDAQAFAPRRFPVFVLDAAEGRFYGFPRHGRRGLKIGRYHHRAEVVHPDRVDRNIHASDEAALRAAVARYFPAANGLLQQAQTCLFTNTPDGHFIIDRAPHTPEVLLVTACSGHGFKFCSVIGEVCADLVVSGKTDHDISRFALDRFALLNRFRIDPFPRVTH